MFNNNLYLFSHSQITNRLQQILSNKKHFSKFPLDTRLQLPLLIAQVLQIKSTLRDLLVHAYRQQDKPTLNQLVQRDIPELITRVTDLWTFHRDQVWLATYKPFGLEIIELRYGGLLARLQSLKKRVNDFIEGKINQIPEFDAQSHTIYPQIGSSLLLDFARAYTPSRNLGIGGG